MKFIFWNISEKTIDKAISDMIENEKPDILLLAETNIDDSLFNKHKMKLVHCCSKKSFGLNKQLKLYSKQKNIMPVSLYGDGDMLVCGMEINNNSEKENYMIFGCHFVSKSTIKDDGKRLKRFMKYREFIESTEIEYSSPHKGEKKNLKGSIIFGDFNTNPFEPAFTDSLGLLALDVRSPLPKKLKKLSYFINPTFSLIGNYNYNIEGKRMASGTYYHDKDIEITNEHYWNSIDGVIFRPSIIENYDLKQPLEIITSIKNINGEIIHKLFDFDENKINSEEYSDHLPIKFNFNF
jgi:hypothetical protein